MARKLTLLVIFGPFVACEVWAKNRNVTVRMSKTEMVRRWKFAMVMNINVQNAMIVLTSVASYFIKCGQVSQLRKVPYAARPPILTLAVPCPLPRRLVGNAVPVSRCPKIIRRNRHSHLLYIV